MKTHVRVKCPRCGILRTVQASAAMKVLRCVRCPCSYRVPHWAFVDKNCPFTAKALAAMKRIHAFIRPEDWLCAFEQLRQMFMGEMIGIRYQVRRLMIDELGKPSIN